jgi:hypothetical protein
MVENEAKTLILIINTTLSAISSYCVFSLLRESAATMIQCIFLIKEITVEVSIIFLNRIPLIREIHWIIKKKFKQLIHCFKIQSSVISCNYCWFYLIVDL